MKTIAAKTIKPKKLVLPDVSQTEARYERPRPVQSFKTLPEQVAKSTICFKNFYVPELRERFRYADRMKRIDLVFPYARLGDSQETVTILVDTPETEQDVEICHQKRKYMRDLGYKYCVIEKDSTLFEVLQQLEAI